MKSKLAIWSWILPVIGFILYPTNDRFADSIGFSFINDSSWPFLLGGMMGASAFLGLIFGIIALIKIKKNPSVSGKNQSIIGIIFSLILLIFSLFLLYVNFVLL